jgi:cell wall-associated NlpC family hydrolase
MEPGLALVTHNVVSMRAEPNGSSEQISQAIMGDRIEILEEQGEFALARTPDAYEGWILRQHLRDGTPEDPFLAPLDSPEGSRRYRITAPLAEVVKAPSNAFDLRTKLVLGTPVQILSGSKPRLEAYARVLLVDGSQGYVRRDALQSASYPSCTLTTVCAFARRLIGTPYLWGGTTPFGFDCSGFVQRLFSLAAVTLPRDAYLQALSPLGKSIPPEKPVREGDLVFFCGPSDPRQRGITHVGLALDRRQFIHASGRFGITITAFEDPEFQRIYTYRGAWRATPKGRTEG